MSLVEWDGLWFGDERRMKNDISLMREESANILQGTLGCVQSFKFSRRREHLQPWIRSKFYDSCFISCRDWGGVYLIPLNWRRTTLSFFVRENHVEICWNLRQTSYAVTRHGFFFFVAGTKPQSCDFSPYEKGCSKPLHQLWLANKL